MLHWEVSLAPSLHSLCDILHWDRQVRKQTGDLKKPLNIIKLNHKGSSTVTCPSPQMIYANFYITHEVKNFNKYFHIWKTMHEENMITQLMWFFWINMARIHQIHYAGTLQHPFLGSWKISSSYISIFQNEGCITLVWEVIFRWYGDKALNNIDSLKNKFTLLLLINSLWIFLIKK